tara:strand:+ start:453 stop:1355 length:903 start_codon:yes stop_codon:yes gene_type:complete
MKKSQLRQIIRESIKELVIEQTTLNPIINWNGSGYTHVPSANTPRCAISTSCTQGAIVGNDIYLCPNGQKVRFTTPSRYFPGVTQAQLLSQPNPYTFDADVEVNGNTPQVGDCFCLNNKANPYTSGYCFKVVIYEIVGPVSNSCNLMGIHAHPSCNFNSNSSPYGCTDPTATNYDPNATVDDGSCTYPSGCTDSNAYNFDPTAVQDDGSCDYGFYCKQLGNHPKFGSKCTPGTAQNPGPFQTVQDCVESGCEPKKVDKDDKTTRQPTAVALTPDDTGSEFEKTGDEDTVKRMQELASIKK